MKKKLLASVLSTLMILSTFTYISASATEELPANIGSDYVAGEVTGNLFTDETTSGLTQCNAMKESVQVHENIKLAGESAAIAKGDVSSSNYNTGNGGKMTSLRDVLDPWAVYKDADGDGTFTLDSTQVDYKRALAGVALQLNAGATTSANRPYMTPDYQKNVVVKIPFTMTAGSGNAVVNIARSKYQTTGPNYYAYKGNQASDHEYPIEYNGRDQGVTVAENGRTYLIATFAGNTTATSDPKYSYTLGMVMGTDAGITVRMEEDEFYIGYEAIHDISVEADKTAVLSGNEATIGLSAKVLNQVGVKGGLSQNFTWYALNSERTAVVDGLNIVEGSEGTATLTIGSTVPAGDYDIVAVSDDYSQLVKGVTISVVSLANDYVAGDATDNEAAYDIRLSADTTTWIPGEVQEINLDCDIVNQTGVTGTLNQDVDWYAMNKERTQMVGVGVTITDSGLGDGKAKLVIDPYSVPAGDYSIVAVSKENCRFVKGIEIEVDYTFLAELDLDKSGNVFTANAKIMNCEEGSDTVKAIIIMVALDADYEVIDFTTKEITSTYSSIPTPAEENVSLTATSAVHHVNAFLWETTGVDNPGVLDTTLNEIAPMKTLDK